MDLVIMTPPKDFDWTHAVSKIEGIYTFNDVEQGDNVRARIVDVGDNHAEAVLLERVSAVGEIV